MRPSKSIWTTTIVIRVSIIVCNAGPAIITRVTITGVVVRASCCWVFITLLNLWMILFPCMVNNKWIVYWSTCIDVGKLKYLVDLVSKHYLHFRTWNIVVPIRFNIKNNDVPNGSSCLFNCKIQNGLDVFFNYLIQNDIIDESAGINTVHNNMIYCLK